MQVSGSRTQEQTDATSVFDDNELHCIPTLKVDAGISTTGSSVSFDLQVATRTSDYNKIYVNISLDADRRTTGLEPQPSSTCPGSTFNKRFSSSTITGNAFQTNAQT